MTNFCQAKEQVFFCVDKKGYGTRFKPKSRAEKQQMYLEYPFVLQTGFRHPYSVKIELEDGSNKIYNPNRLKINGILTRVVRNKVISTELVM